MKKIYLSLILAVLVCASSFATDRCVAKGGAMGCHATIQAAIDASSDGDRILIYPSASPFSEDISIAKSVELHSATDTALWRMEGSITVTGDASREISIINGYIINGNISAAGHSPAGDRCKVNIIGCHLTLGGILFDVNYFNVNITGNKLEEGPITLRYGNLLGNDIEYSGANVHTIIINSDALATDDVINIIGNRIRGSRKTFNSSFNVSPLRWTSSSQFFNISNNYISNHTNSSFISVFGIYITNPKASSTIENRIVNNTIGRHDVYSLHQGISLTDVASSRTVVYNNLVRATTYGINVSGGGSKTISYNRIHNAGTPLNGFTDDGTNTIEVVDYFDNITGKPNTSSPAEDSGYSDGIYTDIDLTRNDAGCYGGPFTMANYFPQTFNGVPRVYFVDMPHRVIKGSTFSVQAEGVDK